MFLHLASFAMNIENILFFMEKLCKIGQLLETYMFANFHASSTFGSSLKILINESMGLF